MDLESEWAAEPAKLLCLEAFRHYHENDKHWAARSQFIARHLHLYQGNQVDKLIALSVVWSNIVFIGNRYNEELTQKVYEMGEGIDIGEVPSYELVPGAKSTKRQSNADCDEQPPKKMVSRFGPRLRFEPVQFVVSTVKEDKAMLETKNGLDSPKHEQCGDFQSRDKISHPSSTAFETSDDTFRNKNSEIQQDPRPFINDSENQSRGECGSFMSKIKQNYSAKFDSHYSTASKDFRSNVLDVWTDGNDQSREGIDFINPSKKTFNIPSPSGMEGSARGYSRSTAEFQDKLTFIKDLSTVVKQNMLNSHPIVDWKYINFTYVLTCSMQTCKASPEYIYLPLKEIPSADLPKNRRLPVDGYACEIRCRDVYLSTGYSGCQKGACDLAAELAIYVLQTPVDLVIVNRKFGRIFQDDLVAYPSNTPLKDIPPSLKQLDDEHATDVLPSVQQGSDEKNKYLLPKSLREFVLYEKAKNPIEVLNNSALYNKMEVEYKYDKKPINVWKCRIFVQGHFIAKGYGNKKSSKHAAAEKVVNIFKSVQPSLGKTNIPLPMNNSVIKELKDVVVYENSSNPVCTLNDTAQFNKVSVEYVFERMKNINWKCKVFMEQQFIAEAIGVKKTVKHDAALEAVMVLKKTQPVVVNNLKRCPTDDAISRNQIRGWSSEEAFKQKIQEDNIGNRLLRKMGWRGGGLGKGGGGIAEPIAVKEQHSREGLGLNSNSHKINKRDFEQIIKNYAISNNQDDLTFSRELTNDERKYIHQVSQKYGLKSKSHGQGTERFLVVGRKRNKQDLIDQLREDGQVGSYALLMPEQQ